MKAIILSLWVAVSSFLGINYKQPQSKVSYTVITPSVTLTKKIEEIVTPSPVLIKNNTPKPSVIQIKPSSSINEEVLKTYFEILDKVSLDAILSNPDSIKRYEQEFYNKFRDFPIPRLSTSDPKKLIALPTKNGIAICSGEELKNLYIEIEPREEQYLFDKTDYDCHNDRSVKETKFCQDWRRDNDQNRLSNNRSKCPSTDYDCQISILKKDLEKRKNTFDQLVEKYCKTN